MGFFDDHRDLLVQALQAARSRGYWSAFPEIPSGKIYGETARADGEAAFATLLDRPFEIDQPANGRVGREVSPLGKPLGITYPKSEPAALIAAARNAGGAWAAASVEERVGVALEMLARINRQSFLFGNAVMHTSGQAFPMAFQAGGPHAQDRGLEAVAYAYDEMTRVPRQARWEKPQGKSPPLLLDKAYRIVPRGIALVIACATFPTWNSYPGLFASLVTGNAVIVKPHPQAILPLALTVRIGREVLREAGFDPNVLLLAADEPDAPVTKELALDPAVGIVDFTGSPVFGRWLRENVRHAVLFTEEAGVNSVVIESTDDFGGMCRNLAFSLSLYSGQMCTAPQNIYVPRGGIDTDEGHKSFDEVAAGIAGAIDDLLSDRARAENVLGAIQSEETLKRIEAARRLGRIVRDSSPVDGAGGARTATPLIVAVDAADEHAYLEERFGPISFVIAVATAEEAIERAARSAKEKGAITAALYSTRETLIDRASEVFARAGVALSVNLTGAIYVNQSAAFSDYHVTGANPAGTACLTDSAFVANRFHIATMRRPMAA
ncbi:phenylacetic acid degradation protein PaaN [Microvirga thermotolerans]|uniref:Phenylacetic acid degradation protein PaaN n=1 Tax=Microvirga thermotolerans TaxID=2651334 RepID=A0A5P9K089_9HYPH|nr:phenylacetic acid degradation protein PaaN [Microvirga thermotolerans]QFU15624.1 phenylacetic acid degradation protein PaaN [Microvirga thermotolerans]